MNGVPGTNWGRTAEQFPHLGNYTLTPGFILFGSSNFSDVDCYKHLYSPHKRKIQKTIEKNVGKRNNVTNMYHKLNDQLVL